MHLPVSETSTSTSSGSCELVTGYLAHCFSGLKTMIRQSSHPTSIPQVVPKCTKNHQGTEVHRSKPLQTQWSLLRNGRLCYSIWLMATLVTSSFCPFANAVFLQVPDPLNVTVGAVAEFFCRADEGVVFWTVNGISVDDLGDPNITPVVGPLMDGLRTRILRIAADVQYNNSVIHCGSFTISDGETTFSDPALLLVQGPLDAVGNPNINLVNGTLCLSWTPPFTLDITNMDPDLYYFIEITSTVDAENPSTITCNNCSSEYKFTMNNSSPCESFTFIVIPVNGAGNGTPSDPLQGSFTQAPPERIPITDVTVTVLQDDQLVIEAPYPSNSVCQFQLTFTSSDDLEPAFSCQIQLSVDLDIEPEGLRLVVQSGSSCQPFTLPLNRVFDMRIVAQNSAGSTTLAEQIRLSTHDAQDAIVSVGPMPGTVTVSVTYAVNTSAMGHLAILVNSSDMAVAFTARDRSSQPATISGLLADKYTALVFDIESDGLPSTAAADSEEVNVPEGSDESLQTDPNLSVEVEVDPDRGVCTTCSFETSNSVGCVVIMHSVLPQLVVHSILREEATELSVEECFAVPFGSYTVAVFNRESSNMIAPNPATVSYVTVSEPPTTPPSAPSGGGLPVSAAIGIAIGVVILFVIVILVICVILYWWITSRPKRGVHAKLLRYSSSTNSSTRTAQGDASPFVRRVELDASETLEIPLSEVSTVTTNTNPASTFGHGSFGYATVGPAASPGPDKTKTTNYTQLDLTLSENPPPQGADHVPYQIVQVQPQAKSNYAQLNLPLNEDPPPPDDPVTYQTIQLRAGATAAPSQPPKPTLPALDINNLDVLLIMIRPLHFLWYQLGAKLGIHDDLLKQIAEFSSEPIVCSTEMLSQWLQYQPESSPPTWEDIARAVQRLGEDSDSAKKVSEQFQHVITTGNRPEVKHSPLPLPAHEAPPPLPPRSDSHSLPTDDQLQDTPPLPPPPVEDPPPTPPSSPHTPVRQPSYSSLDSPEEAPSTPNEEPLSLPSPRRALPHPPASTGDPSSYSHSPVLRQEPPRQLRRRSPPPPPIGELPPYSPPVGASPRQNMPPYTPPLTPLLSSPPIEFHGTMV